MTDPEFRIFLNLLSIIPIHQARNKLRFLPNPVVIDSRFIRRHGIRLEAARLALLSTCQESPHSS